MANPKRDPGISLIKNVLFRVAFAGIILLELFICGLSLSGLAQILPENNKFVGYVLIILLLISLFAIGAASHLIFQRFTRAQYVVAKSERWLVERRQPVASLKRRKSLRYWTAWVPTAAVMIACVFLDSTFALTSHLFHAGSVKLIGYRVSIPLNWIVGYSAPFEGGNQTWSYVTAKRTKGMLRAGREYFQGRQSHLTISEMAFYGAAGDQVERNRHPPTFERERLISSRTITFAGGEITCADYASSYDDQGDRREVSCVTPRGDFSCFFDGSQEEALDFFRVLQSIRSDH